MKKPKLFPNIINYRGSSSKQTCNTNQTIGTVKRKKCKIFLGISLLLKDLKQCYPFILKSYKILSLWTHQMLHVVRLRYVNIFSIYKSDFLVHLQGEQSFICFIFKLSYQTCQEIYNIPTPSVRKGIKIKRKFKHICESSILPTTYIWISVSSKAHSYQAHLSSRGSRSQEIY